MRRICGVVAVLLLGGQLAHGQDRPYGPPGAPAYKNYPNCNGKTFVLIANGESECFDVKDKLDAALEDSNTTCPIITRSISWTAYDTAAANYRSRDVQILGALRLVQEIQRIRQCYPASAIVLIGYCAGTRVVLLAAEQLPAGTVDRIILLTPAVSCFYDPRAAIRASKGGIDVFYASDDTVLEVKEYEFGTCDQTQTSTAGRTGFAIARNAAALASDPTLTGIRQYDISRCGYTGGHFATIWVGFLRRYVVPLIPCGRCVAPGEAGLPPAPPSPPPQGPNPSPAPKGPTKGPPAPPPSGPNPPGPLPPPGYNGPTPAPPSVRRPTGPALPPAQPSPLNRVNDAAPPPAPPPLPLPPPPGNEDLPLLPPPAAR